MSSALTRLRDVQPRVVVPGPGPVTYKQLGMYAQPGAGHRLPDEFAGDFVAPTAITSGWANSVHVSLDNSLLNSQLEYTVVEPRLLEVQGHLNDGLQQTHKFQLAQKFYNTVAGRAW